jgi:hypothetical protein
MNDDTKRYEVHKALLMSYLNSIPVQVIKIIQMEKNFLPLQLDYNITILHWPRLAISIGNTTIRSSHQLYLQLPPLDLDQYVGARSKIS